MGNNEKTFKHTVWERLVFLYVNFLFKLSHLIHSSFRPRIVSEEANVSHAAGPSGHCHTKLLDFLFP